ncbi:hypothetical protein P3X46_011857 [Hevea brasiliensis]|uniref:DNA/RNA-binding protein Alba-like domain-containing protein n=1 Tax=Hevea brasiliensis TaxID=3981 RepID=A0ABQ9MAW4_HEVBR|nr:uncharacterized protein LOC110633376 [Hevea brasiliensis]KAJ9176555.1 hypothetical protein P3X46_011857 [Hevea brasiliensis]
MDRYTRVEKPKPESPINENEIRITSGGPVRNYISYATSLLQEKHVREVVLKAMGQAISKTVSISEGIKRRNPRLHQDTAISSVSIIDVWEPIEEGLLPVEQTRQVSMITITLSFRELNKNSPGYQAPQYVEQPKEQYQQQQQQQQQQPRQLRGPYNAARDDSYGRGRGLGRGRGRNRGRGGYSYGNYQGNYQDNGGYSNWGRGGGRGRSWGYRGTGYERGRGGGGRGYGRGRGRMGGRSRGGGGNQG